MGFHFQIIRGHRSALLELFFILAGICNGVERERENEAASRGQAVPSEGFPDVIDLLYRRTDRPTVILQLFIYLFILTEYPFHKNLQVVLDTLYLDLSAPLKWTVKCVFYELLLNLAWLLLFRNDQSVFEWCLLARHRLLSYRHSSWDVWRTHHGYGKS